MNTQLRIQACFQAFTLALALSMLAPGSIKAQGITGQALWWQPCHSMGAGLNACTLLNFELQAGYLHKSWGAIYTQSTTVMTLGYRERADWPVHKSPAPLIREATEPMRMFGLGALSPNCFNYCAPGIAYRGLAPEEEDCNPWLGLAGFIMVEVARSNYYKWH